MIFKFLQEKLAKNEFSYVNSYRKKIFFKFQHKKTTIIIFTRETPNIFGISARFYIPFKFNIVFFLPVLYSFKFRAVRQVFLSCKLLTSCCHETTYFFVLIGY